MNRRVRLWMPAILAFMLTALSSCSNTNLTDIGSRNHSEDQTGSKVTSEPDENTGWVRCENTALKVALILPPEADSVPDYTGDIPLEIQLDDQVSIKIRIKEPPVDDPSEFPDEIDRLFDSMADTNKDFEELARQHLEINGCPAVMMEYRWTVMNTSMQAAELKVMKDGVVYDLLAVFRTGEADTYRDDVVSILSSLSLLPGEVSLNMLDTGTGPPQETPGITAALTISPPVTASSLTTSEPYIPFSKYAVALTRETCLETGTMDTVLSEFGQTVVIADWDFLKSAYGDMLPSVLAEVGLGDEQAAWVHLDGEPYDADGSRHYFIQRFDGGKPDNFAVIDQIGVIYLGSWYGIELPVLVVPAY